MLRLACAIAPTRSRNMKNTTTPHQIFFQRRKRDIRFKGLAAPQTEREGKRRVAPARLGAEQKK
jgi:hypothetical protein